MPWYKTGTVTVTNGSPAVVGVGTTWGNGAITPGDSFSLVDASGAAVSPHYEVLTVTDDTHLTLTANYGGTTAAGAKYALWNLAGEHTTPYLSALVSALVQRCKLVLADAASYLSQTLAAKTAAEEARDDAQTAKTAAEAAKQAAASSEAEASASATAAVSAKNDAQAAKQAAESAETGAEAAKNAAEAAAGNVLGATAWARHTYTERDLTTVFASEISGYSDVWAWIKARITAANWDGLMIGDYIPFQMNGQTVKAQIAGIDTYYGVMNEAVGHHIDFISRDCFNAAMKWNTTNTNQGTASESSPWLASNAYSVLNGTWYNYLPTALKSVIVEKSFLVETRYSSSGPLTASNSWKWANIGKLWLPSVYEIVGSNVWGTQGYSEAHAVQYPIFANSWQYRRKGAGNGGGICDWWIMTPSGVSSAAVCVVDTTGLVNYTGAADHEFREPVCFRIA